MKSTVRPYCRALLAGGVWFAAVALKMIERHPGHWTTYPLSKLVVLGIGWIITSLLLGVAATRFERIRSWWGIGVGTVTGSVVVLSLMLLVAEKLYGPQKTPTFKTTDEMMVYLAAKAAEWVKADRGIDLDYTVDSIKVIEEELGRLSKEVDQAKPQPGTMGTATGYGAYVGEVLRRRDGGVWQADHAIAGPRSFPLTLSSNQTVFPISWCWKRLTKGEEDNVYHKAVLFSEVGNLMTNAPTAR